MDTATVGIRAALLYCLLAAEMAAPALAADDANGERIEAQVKAAYIYRFAEYIEWPAATIADRAAPWTIGVVGAEKVNAELNQLRLTRRIGGRAVAVRTMQPGDPVSGIQMLYVGALDGARLKEVLDAVPAQGVLSITDGEAALAAGGMISFVQVDRRIRFDVSIAHAERSGLKVSARLLAVAHKVEGARP
jgi:hypothetical protein